MFSNSRIRYAFAGLLFASLSAPAHDYWLSPASFSPPAGKAVALRLYVGDRFKSESEKPYEAKFTSRFELIGADKRIDLTSTGREGKSPIAEVSCPRDGCWWIALDRKPRNIELSTEKFNRYLKDEGLDHILDLRRQAKELDRPGRERYSRCLKALLCAGQTDNGWKTLCNQRIEILLLDSPLALRPGASELRARVLFEGKPLAGVRLEALHLENDRLLAIHAVTDRDGVAAVKLEKPGIWMFRLIHMRRCEDTKEADWESFWTSLMLEVRHR